MARSSRSLLPFLLFALVAASLIVVGEFSGEFGKIRQLSSKPLYVLNVSRGESISLNNGVSFGFDMDSEDNEVLKVRLASNQTFIWQEHLENGKRVLRSESFTLDAIDCSFEIDVTVRFFDKQTMQIVDNTKSAG